MNVTVLIDSLREDLAAVAEIGDERSATVAARLADTLSASLRVRMLDALGQAALELSAKLPSGHVEVRLAGRDPELVYVDDAGDSGGTVGEELSARITLRLPEGLKAAVDAAAAREGVSANTWLVRAIARATESRPTRVGKRLTGYAQS
jgi:HicB family